MQMKRGAFLHPVTEMRNLEKECLAHVLAAQDAETPYGAKKAITQAIEAALKHDVIRRQRDERLTKKYPMEIGEVSEICPGSSLR